jgi:hypothetical protein
MAMLLSSVSSSDFCARLTAFKIHEEGAEQRLRSKAQSMIQVLEF